MKTSHSLLRASAALAALALSACGGGGGGSDTAITTPVATTISQSAVVPYMNDSIAATSDMTAPTDISNTVLAGDETSEPAPI